MINSDSITLCIRERKPFRIGARGICIECHPHVFTKRWTVSVDRAFVYLDVDDINVLDDADSYDLCVSLDLGKSYLSFADLTQYEKLTVIE